MRCEVNRQPLHTGERTLTFTIHVIFFIFFLLKHTTNFSRYFVSKQIKNVYDFMICVYLHRLSNDIHRFGAEYALK